MDCNSNNLLAFIGGFIGTMTHYIYNIHILLNLKIDELFDFTIHSLIGGAIMVAVKVLGDWMIHIIKKDNNENKPNE
ncbi:MAG: hypothetical protein WAQ28_13595 [Bacteroidia bacterium]